MGSGLQIRNGVSIEHVGDETLVRVDGGTEIYRVTGSVALILREIELGRAIPQESEEILEDLVGLGVLSRSRSVSRRALVSYGGLGLGAGLTALSMPAAAASSSERGTEFEVKGSWGFDEDDVLGFRLSIGGPFADPELTPLSTLYGTSNVGANPDLRDNEPDPGYWEVRWYVQFTGSGPGVTDTLRGSFTLDGVEYFAFFESSE
jgi:hypothetical protein